MSKLIEKSKKNLEYSKEICELLNKNAKDNIKYTSISTNDQIGVRQILDKRELIYNTIYLKDTVINEYSLEQIIDIIYIALGTGSFVTTYPSIQAIQLYDEFKENEWDIFFDNDILWFDGDEIYISDILSTDISKDIIKFELNKEESGYSSVAITREGKFYDLEYTE